jgi:hypothetical protein
MNSAAGIKKVFTLLLTTLAVSLAVPVLGQVKSATPIAKLQKSRVVAQGHLSGTKATQQVITWQSANPAGGVLPYAKAYFAIDAVDKNSYTLFQADGGETQYLVDAVQVADLDGDSIPEILSLWWEGASAGAVLRIFHFDKSARAFLELKSDDHLRGVHRYRLLGAARGKENRRVMIYSRTGAYTGATAEYELRNSKIVPVKKGRGEKNVDQRGQEESGIEGQAVIGPRRPHIRQGDPLPDVVPFKCTLIILAAKDNREITRLETGADGRFRVTLSPGEYILRPLGGQGKMGARAGEQTVMVLAGQFTNLNIAFDSGMR